MLRRIIAVLRNERGEASAVSIILGTMLFLTASAGVVAVVGNVLATTAATRQAAIIEDALQARVQTFQSTPWASVTDNGASTSATSVNGVTFNLTSAVTFTSNPQTYTLHLAAPAPTANGSTVSCAAAVTTYVRGCLTVASVRMASPSEEGLLYAVPGYTAMTPTVNTTQKALDIISVVPSQVTFTDPTRIQVLWRNTTSAPASVKYGYFCGASATPVATNYASTMDSGTTTWLILELTPNDLRNVSGCTSATVGIWVGSAAAATSDATLTGYWRISSATGGAP